MNEHEQQISDRISSTFRKGVVLDLNVELDRNEATEFASILSNNWYECLNKFKSENDCYQIELVRPESTPSVSVGERILVNFPDLWVQTKQAKDPVVVGMSATVCQDHVHSKNWVRVAFNENFGNYREIAECASKAFSGFYKASMDLFLDRPAPLAESILHEFEILGQDISDPEFMDVLSEFSNTGQITRTESYEQTGSLEALLSEVMRDSRRNDKPASTWLDHWYDNDGHFVSAPVIDTHRSLYFVSVDPKESRTTVQGISYDTSGLASLKRHDHFQPSSHFTSGKIAAQLASDL